MQTIAPLHLCLYTEVRWSSLPPRQQLPATQDAIARHEPTTARVFKTQHLPPLFSSESGRRTTVDGGGEGEFSVCGCFSSYSFLSTLFFIFFLSFSLIIRSALLWLLSGEIQDIFRRVLTTLSLRNHVSIPT